MASSTEPGAECADLDIQGELLRVGILYAIDLGSFIWMGLIACDCIMDISGFLFYLWWLGVGIYMHKSRWLHW